MKVITKDFITNVLSKDNAACASIRSGETVVFETYDCFTNQFLPEEATFENVVRKPGNPATGPLYIEGAMPGDMLRIEILDIELGPVGIVMLGPGSGSERTEFPEKCSCQRRKGILRRQSGDTGRTDDRRDRSGPCGGRRFHHNSHGSWR